MKAKIVQPIEITKIIRIIGATILALHPMVWLVGNWLDPSYDSLGGYGLLIILGFIIWSWSIERPTGHEEPSSDSGRNSKTSERKPERDFNYDKL